MLNDIDGEEIMSGTTSEITHSFTHLKAHLKASLNPNEEWYIRLFWITGDDTVNIHAYFLPVSEDINKEIVRLKDVKYFTNLFFINKNLVYKTEPKTKFKIEEIQVMRELVKLYNDLGYEIPDLQTLKEQIEI